MISVCMKMMTIAFITVHANPKVLRVISGNFFNIAGKGQKIDFAYNL